MRPEQLDRINELAQKNRTPEGLTPEEKEEQAQLRRSYIDMFKRNLQMQLDNTYIVDENGNKRKLTQKNNTTH